MSFRKKNILFISVKTFNYEKYIYEKLLELGAEVDFFNERPGDSIFIKGIIRLKKNILITLIDNYYTHILLKIDTKKYDYLFVIKGEVVPTNFLREFKKRNPQATTIYYTWDSFENNPNGFMNLDFYDKKFTFDKCDSQKFNISFRPLFFLDKYYSIKDLNFNSITPNLLFIGTAHSDRYVISQNLNNWCKKNNFKFYTYYYIPSVFVFIFKYFFDKTFSKFNFKSLSFRSLSIDEVVSLYKNATIVLDINHPGQSGLTMRTFETLGSGRKLITTNLNIKKYSFYNENNILVINRQQLDFPKEFMELPYLSYDNVFYKKMSLEGWLNSVFIEDNEDFWFSKNINQ